VLYTPPIISAVAKCAHWADRLVRADLAAGYIATENDYTSNFTGAFRREINSRAIPGLSAKAFVLRPSVERRLGADACFIFATPTQFKLGFFEAKWPRLSIRRDSWDSLQKSTGESHFHHQLTRQAMVTSSVAVWEMIYFEHRYGAQPSYAPPFGSACVWHDAAVAADSLRNPVNTWTDAELESLMKGSCVGIEDVVSEICQCNAGRPLAGSDYARPLSDFGVPSNMLLIEYDEQAFEM
jgi:hypothetical protein